MGVAADFSSGTTSVRSVSRTNTRECIAIFPRS